MKRCPSLRGRDRGFAIALLMWMIAGMSLLVTAVIHFARDDIALAEQRLNEARSEAIARGVALMILRDEVLAPYQAQTQKRESDVRRGNSISGSGNDQARATVFTKRYEIGGHTAVATVHPASAYVSLNGGSNEELRRLFSVIGGAGQSEAGALASAVMDYRNQGGGNADKNRPFSGFISREELLVVGGMTKTVYDRVKDYVQPFEFSSLDMASAPSRMKQGYGQAGEAAATQQAGQGQQKNDRADFSSTTDGRVTFESIGRERSASISSNGYTAVEVDVVLQNTNASKYRIWVTGAGRNIVRSERVHLKELARGGLL